MQSRHQKKTGKGRLDKYYHMAKEHGYRSRASFKLIQMNKIYNFLSSAHVLVDLCAAPGGWMQVAVKHMPVGSQIIGVDLDPIKPIKGATGFIGDITTPKCRTDLIKELKLAPKQNKHIVDVFLHDGSPNVGSAWVQDAFSQIDLSLKSLRLSVEFLRKGGWFITKVFRSQDYNSFLWVLNQLFTSVESTKPSASRNTSAEIYVVCKGFLDPKYIDPKLLSSAHVFNMINKKGKEGKDITLKDVGKPIFGKNSARNRQGYENPNLLLQYKHLPAIDFLKSLNPIAMLANNSAIEISKDKNDLINKSGLTNGNIRSYCRDLKIIGRSEIKELLKWRLKMIDEIGLSQKEEENEKPPTSPEEEEPESLESELEKIQENQRLKNRRTKKKIRKDQKKHDTRLKMSMLSSGGAIIEDDEIGKNLFSLQNVKLKNEEELSEIIESKFPSDIEEDYFSGSDFSDNENGKEVDYDIFVENQLDNMYNEFLERKSVRERNKIRNEVEIVPDGDRKRWEEENDVENDESDIDKEDDDREGANLTLLSSEKPSEIDSTNMWFENEIFEEDDEEEIRKMSEKFRNKRENHKTEDTKDLNEDPVAFEETNEPDTTIIDGPPIKVDAETVALARKLGTTEGKEEVLDSAINRYIVNESKESLPAWFVDDEKASYQPLIPIDKATVEQIKQDNMALNARPIAKVIEARARKQRQLNRKLERARVKANTISSSDLTERQKNESIEKLFRKALASKNNNKDKEYLVVGKGSRAVSSAKGKKRKVRTVLVDARMKKERRAMKRIATRGSSKKKKRKFQLG